jgi:hypothetical protein
MRPATFALVILTLGMAAALAAGQEQRPVAPRAVFLPPVSADAAPTLPDGPSGPDGPDGPDGVMLDIKTTPSQPALSPPRVPEFMGDQAPIGSLLRLPNGQILGKGVIYIPSVRYFKISDNGSPQPESASTFSFNYFYNLYNDVNTRAGGGIQSARIHREIFGLEWADSDGSCSFGLRLPLTTYNAANSINGLDGTGTDLGDLTAYWKYRLWLDSASGSLLSAGLAVTPTTAPGSFANTPNLKVFHNTCLQPFCGWIWRRDRFYLQGFTAVDGPTDLNDVVMLENSVAMGYFLYQNGSGSELTAVVPTIELHASTPLNHHGVTALVDPAGNPDQLNITGGVNFEFGDASSMGVAFVRPLVGPKLFDFQVLFQVRYRY